MYCFYRTSNGLSTFIFYGPPASFSNYWAFRHHWLLELNSTDALVLRRLSPTKSGKEDSRLSHKIRRASSKNHQVMNWSDSLKTFSGDLWIVFLHCSDGGRHHERMLGPGRLSVTFGLFKDEGALISGGSSGEIMGSM